MNSAAYALNVWNNQRDKFEQVNQLLIAKPGTHNAASLMKIVQKTGTTKQLNVSDAVEKQLENNYTMFTGLGLRGTPAEQVIPGYVPYQQLEQVLKEQL